ncbi:MAG: hypothetical protein HQM06_13390 [Magnetococcales bacterium]|nr:hypothetical protein [Magnetococcales bacterium]
MNTITIKAYKSDLNRFLSHGGQIPATPESVAKYLLSHAKTHKYSTLHRWFVSIGRAHVDQKFENPTRSDLVHNAMLFIRQKYGTARRKVARLTPDQVHKIVAAISNDRLKDMRDKAILLVGHETGYGRKTLPALTRQNVLNVGDCLFSIKINNHETKLSAHASKAFNEWMFYSRISNGPLFQGINRHGQLSGSPITGHGLAHIIKERVKSIGLDPKQYSALSLCGGDQR